MRVFTTSNEWTTRVEATPAVKPAVDSTIEGVMVTVDDCLLSSGGYTRGITAADAGEEIVAVVS
jgi:hypothetical protein